MKNRIVFAVLAVLLLFSTACSAVREIVFSSVLAAEEKEAEVLVEKQSADSLISEPLETAEVIVPKEEASSKEETLLEKKVPLKEEVSLGAEIFTLGEGTYRETPSAKGKISITDFRSWYESREEGERWFDFTYRNNSKDILDVKWTVVWKDTLGNILGTDEGKDYRLFPYDSSNIHDLPYPEKAVTYEFWVEAERAKPIPSSIDVDYIEHPTAKGKVSVSYELEILNKGAPEEKWTIKIEAENVTDDKNIQELSLYLQEKDRAGKAILPGYSLVYVKRDPHSQLTEIHSSPKIQVLAAELWPGEEIVFDALLFWETANLDFYVQVDKEAPAFLTIEYVPIVGEVKKVRLELRRSCNTRIKAEEGEIEGCYLVDKERYWEVGVFFSAPDKPQKDSAKARVITASGEVFEENDPGGPEAIVWEADEAVQEEGRWYWVESYKVPREAMKLQLIENENLQE